VVFHSIGTCIGIGVDVKKVMVSAEEINLVGSLLQFAAGLLAVLVVILQFSQTRPVFKKSSGKASALASSGTVPFLKQIQNEQGFIQGSMRLCTKVSYAGPLDVDLLLFKKI